MATYTPNINLKKPIRPENLSLDDLNANSDKVDEAIGLRAIAVDVNTSLGNKVDKTTTVNGKPLSANVVVNAGDIANTPAGGIEGVTVQAAVNEIDGKITQIKSAESFLENFIPSGNFSDTVGWVGYGCTLTSPSNTLTLTCNGATAYPSASLVTLKPVSIGNKILLKLKIRTTSSGVAALAGKIVGSSGGTVTTIQEIVNPIQNKWYELIAVITTPANFTGFYKAYISGGFSSAGDANGKVIEAQYYLGADISKSFVSGTTPLLADLSSFLDVFTNRWFSGKATSLEAVVPSSKINKWYGKNALVIGDSLTAAGIWQIRLNTILGMTVTTHALGGIGFKEMVDGYGALPELTSTQLLNTNLIILFGGYNERGIDEGVVGDVYPTQITVAGRLQYTINKIYSLLATAGNYGCRVAIVTPHCAGKYSYIPYDGYTEYPAGTGRTMKTLAAKIAEIANHNSIPCYNAWLNSGISKFNWNYFSASATPMTGETVNDQVHLNNTYGYPHIGTRIAGFIENI